MQLTVASGAVRQRALVALKSGRKSDPRLDLIELAVHGKKLGFGKIIKMIDDLVVTLKSEQAVDSDKKSYCLAEFDKSEDKKKGLALGISDLEKAIEDQAESISTLKSEVAALQDGIATLDASVAEATSTRKAEHDDVVETLAANSAAKDLLGHCVVARGSFYSCLGFSCC